MEPKDLAGLLPEDCAVIVYNYQMVPFFFLPQRH